MEYTELGESACVVHTRLKCYFQHLLLTSFHNTFDFLYPSKHVEYFNTWHENYCESAEESDLGGESQSLVQLLWNKADSQSHSFAAFYRVKQEHKIKMSSVKIKQ